MRVQFLVLAIAASMALASCTTSDIASTQQYKSVRVSYAYAAADKQARAWRAWLSALDECHKDGYQDAYSTGQPVVRCDQTAGGDCTQFHASASYDCVGMGYQAN